MTFVSFCSKLFSYFLPSTGHQEIGCQSLFEFVRLRPFLVFHRVFAIISSHFGGCSSLFEFVRVCSSLFEFDHAPAVNERTTPPSNDSTILHSRTTDRPALQANVGVTCISKTSELLKIKYHHRPVVIPEDPGNNAKSNHAEPLSPARFHRPPAELQKHNLRHKYTKRQVARQRKSDITS